MLLTIISLLMCQSSVSNSQLTDFPMTHNTRACLNVILWRSCLPDTHEWLGMFLPYPLNDSYSTSFGFETRPEIYPDWGFYWFSSKENKLFVFESSEIKSMDITAFIIAMKLS
jgi:hypothetical protein